jgi:hypothetical protein
MNATDSNAAETESVDPASEEDPAGPEADGHLASSPTVKKESAQPEDEGDRKDKIPKKEKKKAVSSKLPLGTVVGAALQNFPREKKEEFGFHVRKKRGTKEGEPATAGQATSHFYPGLKIAKTIQVSSRPTRLFEH